MNTVQHIMKGKVFHSIYFDGCSKGNPGRAGAGAVIYNGEGTHLASISHFVGEKETNNVAEYTGLIVGLTAALQLHIKHVIVKGDSQLVIKQMTGLYQVKSPTLNTLYKQAKALEKQFDVVTYNHIYRKENAVADTLANKALEG